MSDIIKQAQESYLVEFELLDRIAVDVFHSRRGGFLRMFADAWLGADAENKRILRPAWLELIRKYSLDVRGGRRP